jgi:predicted porin
MNLRIMSATALLLGVTAYGGMSGPARAEDLGGSCCADLEQRVAELEATTARKGNRKVSLQLYGQVNTAVMYFDTEKDSDVFIVDNQTFNSRFGLQGSARINPTLSAGFLIEVAAGLGAASDKVTEIDDDGGAEGDSPVAIRHAYWYLDDKRLGRLSVGQLSMVSDGTAEVDLGGTNVVTLSGLFIGNDLTVGGAAFDAVAGGNFELNRNNAVRYDTPTFGGFQLGASFGEDDRWDVALRYAGELSGFRLAAAVGYSVDTDELVGVDAADIDEKRALTSSASILHVASGIFVTGAFAQRVNELNDGQQFDETYWAVRAGIARNWFGIGNTIPYAEYNFWDNELASANDVARAGNEATVWGFGIVQNIDAAAMELYLSYKNLSVDEAQVGNVNDAAHVVLAGARIRF